MGIRQAVWSSVASAAILGLVGFSAAQPAKTAAGIGSVQIIPVSLKNEQVAATVNGQQILVGEVRKLLDARPYPLTLTEEQKKEMRKAAVESLVEDLVMRQYLTKNVQQVNQADFDKEWRDFTESLKKQNKTLEQFYKESGQDETILRRDIVAKLQWKVMLTRYLPDAKAKEYYDANKPFFDKVFVKASHILIKLPPNPSIEQRNQGLQQMQVWRQEILSGKVKFEDVAKQYSQCPSKEKGGDIGQFPYKFVVVPEFAKTAFAMKPGEISDVVQTVFGLHLIKMVERSKGEPSTFEAMKDTVREVWAQDEDLFVRVLTEQRKTAEIKILLQ